MRSRDILALAAILCFSTGAPAADALMKAAQQKFKPIPLKAPVLPDNPATPARVALGKMLYFDPRLSASRSISCNSCHNVGLGGADGEETSLGHGWQRGGRNAPTVFNAVFNTAQFWDGRAKDLEDQAGSPIGNVIETAIRTQQLGEQLAAIPGYIAAFASAFPGEPGAVTLANVQKAIAVFEATLITPHAPFDRYLRGDGSALTADQKQGLRLFMAKGCAECHDGINLGGGMYAPFGILERPGADLLPRADKGRFMVTETVGDKYVFKVPTLRNIAVTPPYFHSGRAWDLRQAVGVMAASQIGAPLDAGETEQIALFMESLTGDPPRIVHPVLPPSVTAAPGP